MSSISSWMYEALWFLGPLAVAFLVGLGCYLFVHWLDDVFPELLAVFEVFLGCVVLYFLLAAFPWSLLVVGIWGGICSVGTCAERAILPLAPSWKRSFIRMLFTTACSMVITIGIGVFALVRTPGSGVPWGLLVGGIFSPSVIPVFLWVWHSSRMRPGVDKPLDGERQ